MDGDDHLNQLGFFNCPDSNSNRLYSDWCNNVYSECNNVYVKSEMNMNFCEIYMNFKN